MSKAFYPTNDGHVGNLEKLSVRELRELLKRQEDLIKKRSFVAKLPDKGEKLRSHIADLQKALADRILSETKNIQPTQSNDTIAPEKLVDSDNSAKDASLETFPRGSSDLENILDRLTITVNGDNERISENHEVPKHYYELALERSEKNLQAGLKQPLKLNRELRVHKVKDLPSDILKSKPKQTPHSSSDRLKTYEESAATPPQYKHTSSRTIDLQESLTLQQRQKQIQEELNAEIAAQKLADRLHIKTEAYNPEGVDMSYRNTATGAYNDGMDSDDDENNDEDKNANSYSIMTSDTED